MATAANRIFNFSAGPATLPLPVLEEAQRDLLSLPYVGMSVMEMSHRSKRFEEILHRTVDDIRDLGRIPSNYKVLMLQGGASLQFAMVPMNLLAKGRTADYVDTGGFSRKAIQEAQRLGQVHVAAENYTRIPTAGELSFTAEAAYVHITNNNTIEGTEWTAPPDVGATPLVNDASSDIFSRPMDFTRYGLVYAGAQKNLGPSGVTLVVIRDDLVDRAPDSLPAILSYRAYAAHDSLYNTPNTFGIYVLGLTMRWLRGEGGVEAIEKVNQRKAAKLYAAIDRTDFYLGVADPDSRSRMNVTFRLESEALEKAFVDAAAAAGLAGLKGHRSVGGIRASIYNAFPEEGVDRLVEFMGEFERTHG